MNQGTDVIEALKLVSDWAKWLVTIETFAIALLGSLFSSDSVTMPHLSKIFGTAAIVCFVISISFAAILLLTLPEIAQMLRPDVNIWLTRDSVAGRILKLNTQGFAIIESFFFGLGVILSAAVIVTVIWTPNAP